jgi:hypothetical protein
MATAPDLLVQAAKLRDTAKRARRLAGSASEVDRGGLLSFAEELEGQASDLERQGAPVVQQQQQQQQHATEADPKPADPEK